MTDGVAPSPVLEGHVAGVTWDVWDLISVVGLGRNMFSPIFRLTSLTGHFFPTDCYAHIVKILPPQEVSEFKGRITSAFLISWAKRMPRKSNLPGIPTEKNFSIAKL